MKIEFTHAAAAAIFGEGSGFTVHANGNAEGKPAGAWLEKCDPSPGVGAAENEMLLWHPLGAIYEPGGPDPQENPSLPIPFTSRQLAACFLHGMGSILAIRFGDWTDGPDEDALKNLLQGSPAAQAAVRAAFDAYREMVREIGPPPTDLLRIAGEICDKFNLSHSDADVAAHASALADYEKAARAWTARAVRWFLDAHISGRETPASDKTGQLLEPQSKVASTPTRSAHREKKPDKYDRLLQEILHGLGIDPQGIKLHRGGSAKFNEKQRAREVALTESYRQQGFTERTFRSTWERLPKAG